MTPEQAHADELVEQIRAAAPSGRMVISAQAIIHWRRTKPSSIVPFVVDVLHNKLNGLSQRNISDIGNLLTAHEVAQILHYLNKPNLPYGVDAMFQDQDPEDFLDIIAQVRDGEWSVNGLTPTCDSSLRRAMRVAASHSVDHPQMMHFRDSDEFMLLVGASRSPRSLLHTNICYSFYYQRAERFSRFAYSNPRLTDADRRELARHSHPAIVTRMCAEGLLDPSMQDERLERLLGGSPTERLLVIAALAEDRPHTAYAEALVATHPELRRLALTSDVPAAEDVARRVISRLVAPEHTTLALVLAKDSNLPLEELTELCAAVTGHPAPNGHVPAP